MHGVGPPDAGAEHADPPWDPAGQQVAVATHSCCCQPHIHKQVGEAA